MTKEQIIEEFKVIIRSLQESTEFRVREEFRAAVQKMLIHEGNPVDGYKIRPQTNNVLPFNQAIYKVLALLQDPKKQ